MNTVQQEKDQVFETQREIREMKSDMGDLRGKINEIHTAIMGSSMTQDGGLVQRLRDVESRQAEMERNLHKIETYRISDVKVRRTLWTVGLAISSLLGYIISYFTHKK